MKSLIILGVLCILLFSADALKVNDTCTAPCKKPGKCVPWNSCSYFRDKLRKVGNTGSVAAYLEQSKCGVSPNSEILTCCPHLLNPAGCGKVITAKQSQAGDPIKHVFPWNGLLVYETIGKNVRVPTCAATLITSQFMLTSGRCSQDRYNTWILKSVRFEWDSSVQLEFHHDFNNCLLEEYDIEEIFLHPMYSRSSDPDIAVLKLKDAIPFFNMFVRPICLPLEQTIQNLPFYGEQFSVAGWPQSLAAGSTKTVQFDGLEAGAAASCREFDKEPNYAGSGGALVQKVDSTWYQVGVVGFQTNDYKLSSDCRAEEHTTVAKYLDWIEDVVNESHC